MAETIDQILERLKNPSGPAPVVPVAPHASKSDIVPLQSSQITGGAFIVSPVQISYIADVCAKNIAESLHMQVVAPKIKAIVEKSLTDAMGTARKQGAN